MGHYLDRCISSKYMYLCTSTRERESANGLLAVVVGGTCMTRHTSKAQLFLHAQVAKESSCISGSTVSEPVFSPKRGYKVCRVH